jgi:glutathione S-transferase
MLTIWGNADSVNVQKVLWCCEEIGLEFHRVDAGRHFGVVNTPEFLRLNPNGLVPTIDDDGFVVWESGAILRYLAAKYSQGQLWPEDPRSRADADRWVDWANSTFWPALVPIFRAFYRPPSECRDADAIKEDVLHAARVAAILDRHLSAHAFVGGDAFTMGDIALGCAAWRWYAMPIEREPLAALDRWFAQLALRPAYRKIVMQPLSV